MRLRNIACLWAAALLLGLLPFEIAAHEGHDHDAAASKISVPAAPRAGASSELFELVAIFRSGELIIYLDRFATNESVSDAAIRMETPQGSIEARATPDGTYRAPAGWAAPGGRYDLIFTVVYKDEADVLTLTLQVPPISASEVNAPTTGRAGSALAQGINERASGSVPSGIAVIVLVLMITFAAGALGGIWLASRKKSAAILAIVVAVVLALPRGLLAHEGEDHGAKTAAAQPGVARDTAQLLADGSVFVPKGTQRILAIRTILAQSAVYRRSVEIPGRIIPDPNASGYVQAVVGGRLSPAEGGFPRLGTRVKKGDVLAYVTAPLQAIDISDMRQRQGELDQQISIVERRVQRYEGLAASGAVSRVQLDEARLELQGLKDRRAALDKVRRDPEPLVAPIDGIVADGTPIAGQVTQTNAVVFHIIDPTRLWVEALSYETLLVLEGATARVADRSLKLAFRGAGFADRNQSIPIHFAIEDDVSGIRVGQFVTVFAETPDEQRGLAVPRSSIVRGSAGQDIVYEHVAAEQFEARAVRIEPLDGQRVLISQGFSAGKRIVVQGAELLDHIR
jgi:hypothetical protein